MKYLQKMKAKLILFVVEGTRERYAEGQDPKQHVAEIYFCARSYREMAAMLRERLPEEKHNAATIAINGSKGWPSAMRWLKPQVGVWVAARKNPITVYQVLPDGTRVEVE
jgi:hypothetical protein